MELKEYYLTDCEYEIFRLHKVEILDNIISNCDLFHLIEFGAGDAYKTKVLLEYFTDQKAAFEYHPIDISRNAIDVLKEDLNQKFPDLPISTLNLDYYSAVEEISRESTCKKVILFLGSNIGNFSETEAHEFFSKLADLLETGDQMLIGFDLKKDPEVVLAAYNDPLGITCDFNLNLLKRINRELDADFNINEFYHYPLYDPVDGAAKSYLISRCKQRVRIGAIQATIEFEKAEPIFMEISQKYSQADIENYASRAGFRIMINFFDNRNYFVNSLWELK
jgi:dimethylhistidine N-methyltransferase